MEVREFYGRIDSNRELVIQPQRLASTVTFRDAASFFGFPLEQLLTALAYPNNYALVCDLYYALFETYGAMIPGEVIDEDYRYDPPKAIRGPAKSMDERGYTDFGIALAMIYTLHERTGDFGTWTIPSKDLWTRMPIGVLRQQFEFVAVGPRAGRRVKILPKAYPSEQMARLSVLRGKLEHELQRVTEDQSLYAERRVSMEYARRVILLNEMQWQARPKPYERQDAALEALGKLRKAIEDLDRAAGDAAKSSASEKRAARELLDYIGPDSEAAGPLRSLLELISVNPHAFPSEQLDDTLDELRRVFTALSNSSLAEEFLDAHVISLFKDVIENVRPEVHAHLADLGGSEYQQMWNGGWSDAMNELYAPGDVKDDSPLAKLAEIGESYESVIGVIASALNESTLPILLTRVTRKAQDATAQQLVVRSLATCALKLIAAACSPHRVSQKGELILGGVYVRTWFEAVAAAADSGDDARLDKLAKEYKRLKFGTQLKSRPVFLHLSFVFSIVSLGYAMETTQEQTWVSTGKLVVEALKTIEGAGELLFAYTVQYDIETGATGKEAIVKQLGAAAAVLSFVVTAGDTIKRWRNMTTKKKVAASISVIGATISVARLLPFVVSAARLAAGLSVVGFVLGAVAFGLEFLAPPPGTQKIFEEYLRHAMGPEGPYDATRFRTERRSVEDAWEVARDAEAFTTLRGPMGEPDHYSPGALPTWRLANAMGFWAEHIIAMFDADEWKVVVSAHIPRSPGSKTEESPAHAPGTPLPGRSDATADGEGRA